MKTMISSFGGSMLSREQMKKVKGGVEGEGWCYYYFCNCGSNSFSGVGNLSQFQSDASSNCSPGDPVNCSFGASSSC